MPFWEPVSLGKAAYPRSIPWDRRIIPYTLTAATSYLAWLSFWISWKGSAPLIQIVVGSPLILGLAAVNLYALWTLEGKMRGFGTAAVALGLLIHGSVAITNWPLRWNFARSQADLEKVFVAYRRGDALMFPVSAGGFDVLRIEHRDSWMLVTVPHRAGNEGLVWQPNPDQGPGFSPFSEIRLGRQWWLVQED